MRNVRFRTKFDCIAEAMEGVNERALAEALKDDPENAEDLIAKNIIVAKKDNHGPEDVRSDRENS